MSRRFIIGQDGRLSVRTDEPAIHGWPMPTDRVHARWPRGETNGFAFRIVRGVVEEFRTYDERQIVFARVVPGDAIPELDRLDAEIADLEARLARARADRQEFLSALLPRSARVVIAKGDR